MAKFSFEVKNVLEFSSIIDGFTFFPQRNHNKKPTNWLSQAKRRATQLENLCRNSVSFGDLAWNSEQIIWLFAGLALFAHFYGGFNCNSRALNWGSQKLSYNLRSSEISIRIKYYNLVLLLFFLFLFFLLLLLLCFFVILHNEQSDALRWSVTGIQRQLAVMLKHFAL